jgi:hypothetical protein
MDIAELALMVMVGAIGLIALRKMDELLDEMRLLRESLNSRLPPK